MEPTLFLCGIKITNYWTFNVINIAMGKRLFILLSYSGNEIFFNKTKKKETSLQLLTVLCGNLLSLKFVNGQFIKIQGFYFKWVLFWGLRCGFMVSLWHFLLVAQKGYKNLVLVDNTKMTLWNSTKNHLLMMKIFNFFWNT